MATKSFEERIEQVCRDKEIPGIVVIGSDKAGISFFTSAGELFVRYKSSVSSKTVIQRIIGLSSNPCTNNG